MDVACMVNIWLYLSAESTVPSGPASWARISSASMPPMRKNDIAATPYMMPIFLWSTVNSHDFQPVVSTGRRNAPKRGRRGDQRRWAAGADLDGAFDDGHYLRSSR